MVRLGRSGALVTPHHPVRFPEDMQWAFPIDLGPVLVVKTADLYSIVLQHRGHAIALDGDIVAAVLAHEIGGPVIGHP